MYLLVNVKKCGTEQKQVFLFHNHYQLHYVTISRVATIVIQIFVWDHLDSH